LCNKLFPVYCILLISYSYENWETALAPRNNKNNNTSKQQHHGGGNMMCDEQKEQQNEIITRANEATSGYVIMDMTRNQQKTILQHKIDNCNNNDANNGVDDNKKKCSNDEYIHMILPMPQTNHLKDDVCCDLTTSVFVVLLFCMLLNITAF
jgi:hypothetical protein